MGWISSAYYVSLPEALDDAVRRPGWLKFGQSHLELGGNDPMIAFLAANGAKLNLRNKAGYTALDYTTGKAGYQGGGAGNLRDPKPSTEAAIKTAMAKYPAQIVADADQPKVEEAPKPAAAKAVTQSGNTNN